MVMIIFRVMDKLKDLINKPLMFLLLMIMIQLFVSSLSIKLLNIPIPKEYKSLSDYVLLFLFIFISSIILFILLLLFIFSASLYVYKFYVYKLNKTRASPLVREFKNYLPNITTTSVLIIITIIIVIVTIFFFRFKFLVGLLFFSNLLLVSYATSLFFREILMLSLRKSKNNLSNNILDLIRIQKRLYLMTDLLAETIMFVVVLAFIDVFHFDISQTEYFNNKLQITSIMIAHIISLLSNAVIAYQLLSEIFKSIQQNIIQKYNLSKRLYIKLVQVSYNIKTDYLHYYIIFPNILIILLGTLYYEFGYEILSLTNVLNIKPLLLMLVCFTYLIIVNTVDNLLLLSSLRRYISLLEIHITDFFERIEKDNLKDEIKNMKDDDSLDIIVDYLFLNPEIVDKILEKYKDKIDEKDKAKLEEIKDIFIKREFNLEDVLEKFGRDVYPIIIKLVKQ